MSTQSPIGSLSTLPRETRDQIYGYILGGKTYIVFGQSFWTWQPGQNLPNVLNPRVPADLAVLQTSRKINQEAENVLYQQSVFRYAIRFLESNYGSAPTQRQANMMRHVEFFMDMDAWFYYSLLDCGELSIFDVEGLMGRPLEVFFGTQILSEARLIELTKSTVDRFTGNPFHSQKTCLVRFLESRTAYYARHIISTPLFQSTTQMMNFRTIILQVECTFLHQEQWHDELEDTQHYSIESESYLDGVKGILYEDDQAGSSLHEMVSNLKVTDPIPSALLRFWARNTFLCVENTGGPKVLQALSDALTPTFGPHVEEKNVPDAVKVVYSRYQRFEPRKHNAEEVTNEEK